MNVFIVTNHEGRPFNEGAKAWALATVEEAEWLAWSISHRKLMWAGISYAECKVVEVDYDEKKHSLRAQGIDLTLNVIDTKTDKQGKLLKQGNYTIERMAQ